MERLTFKKPAQAFETAVHPSHVTFDDGKTTRRNVPWMRYVEARWDYDLPEVMQIEIGEWIVMIFGYNLGPLFESVEEQTLLRVRARAAHGAEPGEDTRVTQIRFVSRLAVDLPSSSSRATTDQLDLGLG